MERPAANTLFEGPVEKWEPNQGDQATIKRMLASKDELDQAYGEAYENGCFVTEFTNMTAVGELDKLMELELRFGLDDLDPGNLDLALCVEYSHPGRGETREDRVRDGVRQVLADRLARATTYL